MVLRSEVPSLLGTPIILVGYTTVIGTPIIGYFGMHFYAFNSYANMLPYNRLIIIMIIVGQELPLHRHVLLC